MPIFLIAVTMTIYLTKAIWDRNGLLWFTDAVAHHGREGRVAEAWGWSDCVYRQEAEGAGVLGFISLDISFLPSFNVNVMYIGVLPTYSLCVRVSDLLDLGLQCELPAGCWELNLGSLEYQPSALNRWAISPAHFLFIQSEPSAWNETACSDGKFSSSVDSV